MSADFRSYLYCCSHLRQQSWSSPSEILQEERPTFELEQAPTFSKAPIPPLPPSFLAPRIRPPHTRAAMRQMRATAPSTYHSLLPSGTPPLLPILLPAPSTSRRADIPEADTPPRKRLLLTTPRPGCEIGESSATAAAEEHARVDVCTRRVQSFSHDITDARRNVQLKELRFAGIEKERDLPYDKRVGDSSGPCIGMALTAILRERVPGDLNTLLESVLTEDFMKCKPLYFKGTEGVVELTQWFERMETVFPHKQLSAVKQFSYSMTWVDLRKKMTDKYCPRNEMKKLEAELWNLKVIGTDVVKYNQRFQELALLCVRMFPEESDKIERYVGGLPDMIHGNIVASRPKTMQEAIEMATELMDKRVSTMAERQAENKRKFENTSRNNQNQQQQQNKRQNTGRAYTAGSGDKKPYGGSRPLCPKYNYHHEGPCAPKCYKCNKYGHVARDCRGMGNANNNNRNNNKGNRGNQAGNDRAPAKVYVVGNAGANPDNVVAAKEVEDKSEKKRLEGVPIVRDFPEVFPEDLPGLPPTRQLQGVRVFPLPQNRPTRSVITKEVREADISEDCLQNSLWPLRISSYAIWFDKRTYRIHRPYESVEDKKELKEHLIANP
ncbi:reverse transcriptase domain-containing protein [Tanacetum coccineum]